MTTVGKVCDHTTAFNFEWEIDNFLSLPEADTCFNSPEFHFAGEDWELTIFPNGESEYDTVGYVGIYLYRKFSGTPISLAWSLSIKTLTGKEVYKQKYSAAIEKDDGHGFGKFLKRSILSEKKSELMACGVLSIVFRIEYCSSVSEDIGNKQKCLDKPIQCSTCKEEVTLRNWSDHECKTWRIKANEKLINDLTALIDSGEQSDVTIKVKDEEFQLHWSILAARNPYFSSMAKAEMKEVTTDVITIHDCEPDIFRSFIYFLYTGKLETLSSDNVCALYKVADKYQEDQVKAVCLNFMTERISVENFCDFVVLALTHDEKELLTDATEFFCKSVQDVLQSVKWQTFMREYPTQANELNVKAFNFYINK